MKIQAHRSKFTTTLKHSMSMNVFFTGIAICFIGDIFLSAILGVDRWVANSSMTVLAMWFVYGMHMPCRNCGWQFFEHLTEPAGAGGAYNKCGDADCAPPSVRGRVFNPKFEMESYAIAVAIVTWFVVSYVLTLVLTAVDHFMFVAVAFFSLAAVALAQYMLIYDSCKKCHTRKPHFAMEYGVGGWRCSFTHNTRSDCSDRYGVTLLELISVSIWHLFVIGTVLGLSVLIPLCTDTLSPHLIRSTQIMYVCGAAVYAVICYGQIHFPDGTFYLKWFCFVMQVVGVLAGYSTMVMIGFIAYSVVLFVAMYFSAPAEIVE